MKINIQRMVVVMLLFFIVGCAYRPVVIDREKVFIGVFKSFQETNENCMYSEVEGVGVQFGVGSFGVGYFDRKFLEIISMKEGTCHNNLVELYIGDLAGKEALKHSKLIYEKNKQKGNINE
tara:strand:+ start:6100 stop:6462 length:363 start_codon:yes stop_codon:yes gene_type:complete